MKPPQQSRFTVIPQRSILCDETLESRLRYIDICGSTESERERRREGWEFT